jgi:hypothetical protein
VRGADQLVWASLKRGDTTPTGGGAGAKQEGRLPPAFGLPVDISRKMKLTDLVNQVSFTGGTGRDADDRKR